MSEVGHSRRELGDYTRANRDALWRVLGAHSKAEMTNARGVLVGPQSRVIETNTSMMFAARPSIVRNLSLGL
jgi:hypothetical protein